MCGERVVFHKTFTRQDFDIFLAGLAVCEIVLVIWFFIRLTHLTVNIWWSLDLIEFITLIAVGWVASWGPLEMQGQATTMMV